MNAAPSRVAVAFIGLGPIGRSTIAHALMHPSIEIAGACDTDRKLVGKPLSELVSEAPRGIRVVSSVEQLLQQTQARVILLCTQSRIQTISPVLETLIQGGRSVVSSCEELIFPFLRQPEWSTRIDALCKQHRVAVLATGVNPGFVLDLLPAVLSGVCLNVRRVRMTRVVDTRTRRGQLQIKVGAGLDVDEFHARARAGDLGHVGLPESAELLCHALGWGAPRIVQSLEPVVAHTKVETPFVNVEKGAVAGQDQRLTATTDCGIVEIELKMFLGAPDPRDEIWLDAEPPIHCLLEGGVAGDLATVATLLNAASGIAALSPGLRTVVDCPPLTHRRIG